MSDIPAARQLLNEVIELLPPGPLLGPLRNKVVRASTLLSRRAPTRPEAPRRRTHLSQPQREAIKTYALTNPTVPIQTIAEHFGVNMSAVSRLLRARVH